MSIQSDNDDLKTYLDHTADFLRHAKAPSENKFQTVADVLLYMALLFAGFGVALSSTGTVTTGSPQEVQMARFTFGAITAVILLPVPFLIMGWLTTTAIAWFLRRRQNLRSSASVVSGALSRRIEHLTKLRTLLDTYPELVPVIDEVISQRAKAAAARQRNTAIVITVVSSVLSLAVGWLLSSINPIAALAAVITLDQLTTFDFILLGISVLFVSIAGLVAFVRLRLSRNRQTALQGAQDDRNAMSTYDYESGA